MENKKGRDKRPAFPVIEASYFLSILSVFFLPSPFFFSIFFLSPFFAIFLSLAGFSILSIFLSCATALCAAKAEAVTAVNISATISGSSLLISFSWLVFENGWTRRFDRYP